MALDRVTTTGLAGRLFEPGSPQALAFLRAAWPAAVGPDLARRTEVLAIEGATLRLRVPDPRWRKVLHRMQRDILRRLHDVAGSLAPRRLGFTEGGIAAPPKAESEVAPVPTPERASRPLPESVAAAAEAIADPEVRVRFALTAARYLDRFR